MIFEPNEDNDTYVPPIFEPMTVEDRGKLSKHILAAFSYFLKKYNSS